MQRKAGIYICISVSYRNWKFCSGQRAIVEPSKLPGALCFRWVCRYRPENQFGPHGQLIVRADDINSTSSKWHREKAAGERRCHLSRQWQQRGGLINVLFAQQSVNDLHCNCHMCNDPHPIGHSWALSVFLNTFNSKKLFFSIFYQVHNIFLHWVLFKKPTPSQINLIKNAKNHFILLKKLKNTESAQSSAIGTFSDNFLIDYSLAVNSTGGRVQQRCALFFWVRSCSFFALILAFCSLKIYIFLWPKNVKYLYTYFCTVRSFWSALFIGRSFFIGPLFWSALFYRSAL